MNWGIRSCALAAGAAALLSTQAAYAAPVATHHSTAVDPLVSLSMLATSQSRASMLASTAVLQDAPPATKTCADGRVIPVNDSCDGLPPPPPPAFNPLLVVLGVVLFAALIAALVSGGGNAHGDLTPVSPA